MQLPPLKFLLSWPTSNYVDPIDHGAGLLIVNLVLTPLIIAFIARAIMIDGDSKT